MKEIKLLVQGFYDHQGLRINVGNKVCAHFYEKLGKKSNETKDELDQALMDQVMGDYKRISDAFVDKRITLKNFKSEGIIDSYAEFQLCHHYASLLSSENHLERSIKKIIETHPLWDAFLKDVRGCGPLMAGVILACFDIHKAKYPSQFIRYAGLAVEKDGQGQSRKKEHLVEKTSINHEGEIKTHKGISFNPFLKTKMVGVLGSCFIKAGGKYSEIYRDYKNRLENHPKHIEKSKGHRHNMSMRYMVKQFLIDLHIAWRELEGLEVSRPYHEAKLGIFHKAS